MSKGITYYRHLESKTDAPISDEKMRLILKDISILRNNGKTENEINKIIKETFHISVSSLNPSKKNTSFEERLKKMINFLLSCSTIEQDQYSVTVKMGEKVFYIAKDINNNDKAFIRQQIIFDICCLDKDFYKLNRDITLKRIIREELRKFLIIKSD